MLNGGKEYQNTENNTRQHGEVADMGRINKQNLRTPTSEEAREMQKKSVEKRRENKTMREIYVSYVYNNSKRCNRSSMRRGGNNLS